MAELNSTQLQELMAKLHEERKEIKSQLKAIEYKAVPVSSVEDPGKVARSSAIQTQQMALAQQQRLQSRLAHIQAALNRADEDEDGYGYCLECGEPIGYERLKIKPDTQYCVKCREEKERKKW